MLTFAVGVLLAGYAAWLALRYGSEPRAYYVGEFVHVGSYLIGGLVASLVAAGKPIGRRMMLAGVVLAGVAPVGFTITATGAPVTLTQTVAVLLIGLQFPAVGQALLTYPTGVIPDRATRLFLRALWAYGALTGVVLLVTWAPPEVGGSPGAAHLAFTLIGDHDIAERATAAARLGVTPFVLAGIALFARRLITAGRRERRLLTIPAVPILATALLTAAWLVTDDGMSAADGLMAALTYMSAVAVPVSVLAGLTLDRIRQGRVTDLLRGIQNARTDRLRDELAYTLDDPALRLVLPGPDGPIDDRGRPATLPGSAGPTRTTAIGTAGWLIHDKSLLGEPGLLAGAVAAAGMALQIEAELDARRAAQRRIVEAQDTTRRRIERDLHDGAQQRLFSLGVRLQAVRQALCPGDRQALRRLDEADDELLSACRELRELARGIHPAVLVTHGLVAALEHVVMQHPIPVDVAAGDVHRCPPHSESTAYFVAVEALANVTKHAGATRVRLTLRTEGRQLVLEINDDGRGGAAPAPGSGLEGLGDRAGAIGGTFTIESPAGGGTTIRAVLPCDC
jgi:signal transduction histidine kinase